MSCDPSRTIETHPARPQAAYTVLRPTFAAGLGLPDELITPKAPANARISAILGLRGSRLNGIAKKLVARLAEIAADPYGEAMTEMEAIRTVLPTLRRTDEVALALRQAARHPHPWVRAETVRAIGDLLDDELIVDAVSLLNDREPNVRQGAMDALHRFGVRALPILDTVLRSKRTPEAAAVGAVYVVMHMIGSDCIRPDDPTQADQFRAITNTLLESMDDPRPNVRTAAIAGLSSLFTSLPSRVKARIVFASINDPEADVRQVASDVLEQAGTYMGNFG